MIHRLKQQSDITKRRIAFGVSGLVSALVFVGWLASFGAPDTSERVARNREASPLRLLVQGVQSTIQESASEFTPTTPRIVDLRADTQNPLTRQSASIFSAFTSIPDDPSLLSQENSEEQIPVETQTTPLPPPPSQQSEPVSPPPRPVDPAPKKELVIIIPSRN